MYERRNSEITTHGRAGLAIYLLMKTHEMSSAELMNKLGYRSKQGLSYLMARLMQSPPPGKRIFQPRRGAWAIEAVGAETPRPYAGVVDNILFWVVVLPADGGPAIFAGRCQTAGELVALLKRYEVERFVIGESKRATAVIDAFPKGVGWHGRYGIVHRDTPYTVVRKRPLEAEPQPFRHAEAWCREGMKVEGGRMRDEG